MQKHAARRLHYDLRLELGGVLKSWAVPKGPSLDPRDVRLAVEVEDHPLEYADFEGSIPKGEYGGGTVLVWDRGAWTPRSDPERGLREGKLRFRLEGDKLTGDWILVRTRGGDKPSWILRKVDDERARRREHVDVAGERPESAVSGRTLEAIAAEPPRVWHSDRASRHGIDLAAVDGARPAALPEVVSPQLATAVSEAPEGPGWIHELKLDGYRILARVRGGRTTLLSRRGHDWTDRFARIAAEVAFLPVDTAIFDGEVVYRRADGTTDFQALQNSIAGAGEGAPLAYEVFDLLYLDGHDLRGAPLDERKRVLRRLLVPAPADVSNVHFSDHVEGHGGQFFAQACQLAIEGVVSKRRDAPYRPGRGRDWVKIKCTARQEFVVVGYTRPRGSRAGFGALLLAYHDDDGRLTYAGRVGTGFDDRTLERIHDRLRAIERPRAPVEVGAARARGGDVTWVDPVLVAEVQFAEWTRDGVIRHATFEGLREDVAPQSVGRERPAAAPDAPAAPRTPRNGVAGVSLTNPDRVFYPDAGITKRDLVRHYERVAERMLPEIAGRPLTLVRCPTGIGEPCFYQKHLAEEVPDTLGTVDIEEKAGDVETYLTCDSLAGLATLAQLGVLEIHPWGSRVAHLDRPDRLIFDLDPHEDVGWNRVVRAARDLRELLRGLELESVVRITGGKGLHVVVPIVPEMTWPQAKDFTLAAARLLSSQGPGLYTTNPLKARRGGRIFIDYLRNTFGATAIASFSTRARPSAPVAIPVGWDELDEDARPVVTLQAVESRLRERPEDPWAAVIRGTQRIQPAILDHLTRRRRS